MNAIRIRHLRVRLGYTRSELARVVGIHPIAVTLWEEKKVSPSGPSKKLLEYLERGVLRVDPEEVVRKRGRPSERA
jgi:DNA-binding transcriptional regulator YiaG